MRLGCWGGANGVNFDVDGEAKGADKAEMARRDDWKVQGGLRYRVTCSRLGGCGRRSSRQGWEDEEDWQLDRSCGLAQALGRLGRLE